MVTSAMKLLMLALLASGSQTEYVGVVADEVD